MVNVNIAYWELFLVFFLIWVYLALLWTKYNDLATRISEVNTTLINIMAKIDLDNMDKHTILEKKVGDD